MDITTKIFRKFMRETLKPGLSFIFATHNQQENLHHSLMSIIDIADEIILLDLNSTDTSFQIAEKIASKYPSVLRVFKKDFIGHRDVFAKEKYLKWCFNKVSKYNVINWDGNCIADTDKLQSLIKTLGLKDRDDKFHCYIKGKRVLSCEDNYYSPKLGDENNGRICYSKLNYTHYPDLISGSLLPSSQYLKTSREEKPEESCFYNVSSNQNFKSIKSKGLIGRKLGINNLFLKREPIKDKPLFLIGSGPSLREHDISKLKNCYTMSFNRSYIAFDEWGFQPTYFAGLDHVVNKDNRKEFVNLINNSRIQRFFFPNDNTSKKYFKSTNVSIIDIYGGNSKGPDLNFTTNLTTANTGLFGLQIAIGLLGFKEVYLLGCDANYKEKIKGTEKRNGIYFSMEDNDTNHFRQDYFGKGTIYNKPNSMKWHYPAWKSFFETNLKDNTKELKVYNCSSTGKLTFFEFADFSNIVTNIESFEIE